MKPLKRPYNIHCGWSYLFLFIKSGGYQLSGDVYNRLAPCLTWLGIAACSQKASDLLAKLKNLVGIKAKKPLCRGC